jgi:predicted MPP superfamily phosphohydrolase
VFLGDYFSPYRGQSYETCKSNLIDILMYKTQHPDTILLLGNHDIEAYVGEAYSRHDYQHAQEIFQMFELNKNNFQIAAAIGDYLITHAGVTTEWKDRRIPDVEVNPQNLASAINQLWLDGKYFMFDFNHNGSYSDYYGTSPQQGPLWVRWNTLCQHNVFKGTPYKQIVGHTVEPDFRYCPNKSEWNLICIDCMAYQPKSLILDIE